MTDTHATRRGRSQPYLPLFVYGTLMRGERAHALIAPQVQRASAACLQGAALYDLGRYPVAIASAGSVSGELYWLTEDAYDATLDSLDRYEGHEYVRVPLDVLLPGDDVNTLAWVFLGKEAPVAGASLIPHGDWRKWQQGKRT